MDELLKKIDEEIEMYQKRIAIRQGANYHDESERIVRLEERLNEAIRIKEIIQAEQKEPCEYCKTDLYKRIGVSKDKYGCNVVSGDILEHQKFKYCPMCGRPIQPSTGTE